jgi:hypothetical protein
MANVSAMEGTTGSERRPAGAIVGVLEQTPAELAPWTTDGDVAWIGPLAVPSAGVEHSGARRPGVDSINPADECRELRDLLASDPSDDGEFAWRFAIAHRAATTIAAVHDRWPVLESGESRCS